MFKKNVHFKKVLSLSPWRKIALGTWRTVGDPSAYGTLEVDVEPVLRYLEELKQKTGKRVTVTHVVGKIVAESIKRHPEINCILRFGRLYQRATVDVFFQVASDNTGDDLSGMVVRNADQKTVIEIATEMEDRVKLIKTKKDNSYTQMKTLFKFIPGFVSKCMIDISSFIMYTLNIWSPAMGVPRDSFGSVMITNIGSLGLDEAFAPLVPYSRVPFLIALGRVKDVPVVKNGQVVPGKTIKLGATFDHRLVDGVHAGHMVRTLQKFFADPGKELGS